MLLLDIAEFAQEGVELLIGDLGSRPLIVQAAVPIDLAGQFKRPLFRFFDICHKALRSKMPRPSPPHNPPPSPWDRRLRDRA